VSPASVGLTFAYGARGAQLDDFRDYCQFTVDQAVVIRTVLDSGLPVRLIREVLPVMSKIPALTSNPLMSSSFEKWSAIVTGWRLGSRSSANSTMQSRRTSCSRRPRNRDVRRTDAVSINCYLDDSLWLGRAHSKGAARQSASLFGFAVMVNALAIRLHRIRRAADSPEGNLPIAACRHRSAAATRTPTGETLGLKTPAYVLNALIVALTG
jgi:hypothetical protein